MHSPQGTIGSVLTFLVVSNLSSSALDDAHHGPIIRVSSGEITGKKTPTVNGRVIYAFQGIRYANPPVGDARFKLPVPVNRWTGICNATSEGPSCPQWDYNNKKVIGEEDCLFLNVYTPELPSETGKKLPVMVYIHGGGFIRGSGSTVLYSPNRLLDRDIVLVTFNYRLGVLGFLSTLDEYATGNYGMFDQLEVLKWVQENIAKFNGDPSQVTLFGESAGAGAVSHHLISPHSRGLFRACMLQSGTSLCDWAIQKQPRKWVKLLAIKLDCPAYSSRTIVDCIKERSVTDIVKAHASLQIYGLFPLLFAPIVERTPNGFLPGYPHQLFGEKKYIKVPTVIGITRNEGAFPYASLSNVFDHTSLKFLEEDLPVILPTISDIDDNFKSASQAIIEEYFQDISSSDKPGFRNTLLQMYTDAMFSVCAQELVTLLTSDVPTYAYLFTHRGEYSFTTLYGHKDNLGVSHLDDVQYLFGNSYHPHLSKEDQDISNIMTTLWTNFASTMNPTPNEGLHFQWHVSNTTVPSYLEINSHPSMKEGVFSKKTDFWKTSVRKVCPTKSDLIYPLFMTTSVMIGGRFLLRKLSIL